MEKREKILEEAEKVFAERGYYGLSLSELFTRCDIPKGSFYYFFPGGKNELLRETLKYSYQKMADKIDRGMSGATAILPYFEGMTCRLAEGIREKRTFPSLLMTMIAIESVYLGEEINATCQALYTEWQMKYERFLLRFGMEPAEAKRKAQAIFALVHGSMVSAWIKQDAGDLMLAKAALRDLIGDR